MRLPWKSLVEYLIRRRKKALEPSPPQREGLSLWSDSPQNSTKSTSCGPSLADNEQLIELAAARIVLAALGRFTPEGPGMSRKRRAALENQGREMWKDFRRTLAKSNSFAQLPEADKNALRALQRLAPEAVVSRSGFLEAEIRGEGITANCRYVNGKCCAYTFGFYEHGIPPIEQALTLYLWKKLFPMRYRHRPLMPEWKNLP
jgi:hypothetical protein